MMCHIKKYEDEQEENTRTEKSIVAEIKEKLLSMLHTLPNNELLMDMYKKEVANKDKGTHIAFYYSVSGMIDECNDDEDEAVQDEE